MSSTIVVTGAHGDIGRVVVEQALQQGRNVIATVRNPAHVESFQKNLLLKVITMDVDDQTSVEAAFAQIDEEVKDKPLHSIIHCAAIISPCIIENLDAKLLEGILKTNSIGSFRIMQAAFPRLRGTNKNLILCSSFWGRISGPMVGAYAASKWALEALADAARRETKGMGFNIVLANIGAVRGTRMLVDHKKETQAFLERSDQNSNDLYAHIYRAQLEQLEKADAVFSDVNNVAAKLLRIANKRKPSPRYKIGKDSVIVCFLSWLLPASWLDKGF